MSRKPLVAFGVLAALAALEIWRLGSPAPAPADAPPGAFSATRAIATLRAVSLDEPHPVGTAAHDEVRDRAAAAMKALGYDVEVQHAFACNALAVCSDVDNIIATAPGQPRGGSAVAIVAHYDSVPAGPGASDDGTGVATVIEVARALRHERLANPIVFLIDDGEEGGLLGAEGFVADRARASDIAFYINVEARGTSGTPFLFETSRDNRWLIPTVASALPRPVTTSLFATIYERLPNDTDLTVFKHAGRAGINFAYLGDGTQYHTPLDNFANVDLASVQHRGDQVLAMARAFGNARLDGHGPGDAVWFDVFTLFVVWWPATWSVWIAVLAIALAAAAIVVGARRGAVSPAGVLLGVASFAGTVALAYGLGALLGRMFGSRAGALFSPHPEPMIAAAWLAGLAAAMAVAALARKRASFDSLALGHAVAWNALGVVLALRLPGAAYVALVPGTVMSGLALVRVAARRGEELPSVGALVAACAVYLAFALVVYDTMGTASIPAIATMLGLIGTTFAPMLAPAARRVLPVLLAGCVVLAVIALLVPTSSPSHPRHLSLAHVTDGDAGTARWQADAVPPLVGATARFEAAPQPIAPWLGRPRLARVAPAPGAALEPPEVHVAAESRDPGRVATLDLSSPRHAARLQLVWRGDTESIRINGVTPPARPARARSRSILAPGWNRIIVRGASARIEITTRGAAPVEAIVSDTSYGLPPLGAPLRLARDLAGAVPVQDGDVTIVQRRVTW